MLDLDPGTGAVPGERSQPVEEVVAALQAAAAAWGRDQPGACGECLERLGDAAEAGGLPGLKDLCLLMQQSLGGAAQADSTSDERRRALEHFARLAEAYVRHPCDRDAVAVLIARLREPPFAVVQSEEDAVCLADMLLADGSALGEPLLGGAADGGLVELQLLEESAAEKPRSQEDAALPSLTQMFDLGAMVQPARSEFVPEARELVVETGPASRQVWAEAASDRLADLSDSLEAAAVRLQETAAEQRVTPQTPLQLRSATEPAGAAGPLPAVVRELIDVMIGELPEVDTALATFVGLSQAKGVDADVVNEAFERAAAVV